MSHVDNTMLNHIDTEKERKHRIKAVQINVRYLRWVNKKDLFGSLRGNFE